MVSCNRSGACRVNGVAEFLPCSPPLPSSCRLRRLPCPAGVTRRGGADLPLPAQLLGTDKKGFELWSLPLISASGRPRCCPPASKAPPGFCPSRGGGARGRVGSPAAANEETWLISFSPGRSKSLPGPCLFLSRPVLTSRGRAGRWVSGCRRCVSCEMKR